MVRSINPFCFALVLHQANLYFSSVRLPCLIFETTSMFKSSFFIILSSMSELVNGTSDSMRISTRQFVRFLDDGNEIVMFHNSVKLERFGN